MSSDIAIVVPIYNEEHIVKEFFTNLKKTRPNDTIIAVDDASTDASSKILNDLSGIYLLTHELNLGQGAALQTGIVFARTLNLKYAVTIDSDGQHNPNEIELFEKTIKKYNCDIVLGSRFLGNTINMSKTKRILLKLSIFFTMLTTGIKLTDSHNGFRIIDISNQNFNITQNRMSHASEIIEMIQKYNLTYKEVPCTVVYNDYTVQKGQKVSNIINILLEIFFNRISS